MKQTLLHQLDKIHYFTIESYMQIAELGNDEKPKARSRLSRAVNAGQILRLKRGIYLTTAFYNKYAQDERFIPIISQIINPLSYVSSIFILQKYNILTEGTYSNTAVTLKNTNEITNKIGTFYYHAIKRDLYLGFSIHEFLGLSYNIASLAKALFDYLHLKPIPRPLRTKSVSIAREHCLNLDLLTDDDKMEFTHYVAISDSEKMNMIVENFQENSWQL